MLVSLIVCNDVVWLLVTVFDVGAEGVRSRSGGYMR
jgi:hypothetical protein